MRKKIGAELVNESCRFCVWAPLSEKVELIPRGKPPVPLKKDEMGYWVTEFLLPLNSYYKFRIDSEDFPDPASRFQPEGVHSWSQVVTTNFKWDDSKWEGLSISEMIIYELHVGTFSEEGIFEGIIEKLDHFLELGVNTLELMPVSQFSGGRNWGYDGVYPFAVQNSYGTRESLKKLVNACHEVGIAVLLDVVYNHMGPEGNYLSSFGPYFTEKYHTPWGKAINFDDEYSDGVRNFFIENALMWLEEFHFDGLRLDAVHEIIDRGARHFLQELSEAVDELQDLTGRKYVLIAESDLNDARMVSSYERGGYALDAQWVDDFHHSFHSCLTGEHNGYYSDYGELEYVRKTLQQAFVYDGKYSTFRKKSIGNSPRSCKPENFLVSLQNHDQVGNRLMGERLNHLISFEAMKLVAGLLLISPFTPMLFMGEEFAEKSPFLYFVSHSDPKLVKAVQEGRKKEFSYFLKDHQDQFPDPQAEETFEKSKLNWEFKSNPSQKYILEFYKFLITTRKNGGFNAYRNDSRRAEILQPDLIHLSGVEGAESLLAFANLGKAPQSASLPEEREWKVLFASADQQWGGTEDYAHSKPARELIIPGESLIVLVASGET